MITFTFTISVLMLIFTINYAYVQNQGLNQFSKRKTTKIMNFGFAFLVIGIVYINFFYVKKELTPVKARQEITDEEIQELLKTPSEHTKEDIENLLSGWDGSLPALVDYVKERLHNPDSFEHVETGFINKTDYIQMKMIYRAENGFGAIRKSAIVAKIDFYGNIIEIISQ